MEDAVRAQLTSAGVIEDTVPFAETSGFEHTSLIGVCKSLAANDFIACANLSKNVVRLSAEGKTGASDGQHSAGQAGRGRWSGCQGGPGQSRAEQVARGGQRGRRQGGQARCGVDRGRGA